MNKKILFVLGLSSIFAGCAHQVAGDPPGSLVCKSYAESKTCDGQGNSPRVTIDLDKQTVTPECINANKESVIVFKIDSKGEIKKNSVEIRAQVKNDDDWLAGKNHPSKKHILVRVAGKGKDGKSSDGAHKYGVWTKDWCVDPRVNVN